MWWMWGVDQGCCCSNVLFVLFFKAYEVSLIALAIRVKCDATLHTQCITICLGIMVLGLFIFVEEGKTFALFGDYTIGSVSGGFDCFCGDVLWKCMRRQSLIDLDSKLFFLIF